MTDPLRSRTYGGPHPSSGSAVNAFVAPSDFQSPSLAAQFADLWVRYCTHATLTPHTAGSYASCVRAFLRYCGRASTDPSALQLASPDLRGLLTGFDEAVMAEYATSTAGRRQRCLRTLVRYAMECGIEVSPPAAHWAATPPPITPADEVYQLDEFSKDETVRMRRAARRDVEACVARLEAASDADSEFADVHRWAVESLRAKRSVAEVATTLRQQKPWLDQVIRLTGATKLADEGYVQLAHRAISIAVPNRRELMAFFILLAWPTGREPEVLRRLRLSDIAIDQTRATLHLTKTRAAKVDTFVTPSDGSGGRLYTHIRQLIAVTDTARAIHESDYLWLATVQQSGRVGVTRWHHARYGLHEYDADTDLQLSRPHDTRRIRKTAKALRAIRGGSLQAAVQGDHTEDTYRRHYQHTTSTMVAAAQAIHDAQERVVEAALRITVIPKLAREINTTEVDAETAASISQIKMERPAEQALTATGCRDRRNGPLTKPGELCLGPPLACIGCSNAVVTLEHLPRILLAQQHIEELRDGTEPSLFLRQWGPALDWITAVLQQFSPDDLERARRSPARLFIPITQRLTQ